MNEINVGNILSGSSERATISKAKPQDLVSDFKTALSQSIEELNTQLSQADQSAQEMALGKADVHQAMITMEQANLSLRLMIDVRNKIIAAYEEIMRLQL
jgi:flagellar hook-basal body complex protein FliE